MNEKPLFDSAAHAVRVMWPLTARLSALLMWTVIALLHTTLLALALLALWVAQASPADVASAARNMLQTWPAVALGAAGASALTLLSLYWWLLKRLHRALGKPLAEHLMRDA